MAETFLLFHLSPDCMNQCMFQCSSQLNMQDVILRSIERNFTRQFLWKVEGQLSLYSKHFNTWRQFYSKYYSHGWLNKCLRTDLQLIFEPDSNLEWTQGLFTQVLPFQERHSQKKPWNVKHEGQIMIQLMLTWLTCDHISLWPNFTPL